MDEQTGFTAKPILPPEGGQGTIVTVNIPGAVAYRNIRVTMSTPGTIFYGIRCHNDQPRALNWKFDWNVLPHGRVEI